MQAPLPPDLRAQMAQQISVHGWIIPSIFDKQIPWAYTIGLANLGHRELVMVGLPPLPTIRLLDGLADAARRGVDIHDPDVLAADLQHDRIYLRLKPVDASWKPTELLAAARLYHQGNVPEASQVVASDKDGRFPWELGYNMPFMQVPLWEPYPGGWPAEPQEQPR